MTDHGLVWVLERENAASSVPVTWWAGANCWTDTIDLACRYGSWDDAARDARAFGWHGVVCHAREYPRPSGGPPEHLRAMLARVRAGCALCGAKGSLIAQRGGGFACDCCWHVFDAPFVEEGTND